MNFSVNWAGKEKVFPSKADAMNFMNGLSDGSDLWFGVNTLILSRTKQPDGTFKIEDYLYD